MMDTMQGRVQAAIDQLVASGAERGLQVAVYRHGEPVVDAVAGVADPATGREVASDTPFYSYSAGPDDSPFFKWEMGAARDLPDRGVGQSRRCADGRHPRWG